MEDAVLVIMLKNKETGYLEEELGTYTLNCGQESIASIYAQEGQEGLTTYLSLTCTREISDWEYEAIFDYYDPEVFQSIVIDMKEAEGHMNPVWIFTFPFIENATIMEEKITKIVELHEKELTSVYETIVDKEDDYSEQ